MDSSSPGAPRPGEERGAEQAGRAILQAVAEAYLQARADGLCAAGAWEVARQHLSDAQLAAVLRQLPAAPTAPGGRPEAGASELRRYLETLG